MSGFGGSGSESETDWGDDAAHPREGRRAELGNGRFIVLSLQARLAERIAALLCPLGGERAGVSAGLCVYIIEWCKA